MWCKVNNRKVLDGVLEAIGLAGDENAGRRLTVLRAIDKLDRLGPDGVRAPARAGPQGRERRLHQGRGPRRRTRSSAVLAFTSASTRRGGRRRSRRCATWSATPDAGAEGVAELADIAALVTAGGYDDGRVVIDPSVVRGLEYYTGPVFEAELTFEVTDEDGRPVRFGSVGGGGRYDGLVGALPRRAGAGDRLLHRRVAAAGAR